MLFGSVGKLRGLHNMNASTREDSIQDCGCEACSFPLKVHMMCCGVQAMVHSPLSL